MQNNAPTSVSLFGATNTDTPTFELTEDLAARAANELGYTTALKTIQSQTDNNSVTGLAGVVSSLGFPITELTEEDKDRMLKEKVGPHGFWGRHLNFYWLSRKVSGLAFIFGIIGVFVTIVAFLLYFVDSRPPLNLWGVLYFLIVSVATTYLFGKAWFTLLDREKTQWRWVRQELKKYEGPLLPSELLEQALRLKDQVKDVNLLFEVETLEDVFSEPRDIAAMNLVVSPVWTSVSIPHLLSNRSGVGSVVQ